MNLSELIPPVQQDQMTRRAWADYYIWKAAWHQVHDPGSTSDRALAMYITIGRRHGLSEQEIMQTIRDTRREEAAAHEG